MHVHAFMEKPSSVLISFPKQLIFISNFPHPGFLMCQGQRRKAVTLVLLPLECDTCPEVSGHLSVLLSPSSYYSLNDRPVNRDMRYWGKEQRLYSESQQTKMMVD